MYSKGQTRLYSSLLALAILLFLSATLLYPIWLTIAGAFESKTGNWTLHHFWSILQEPSTQKGLINALLIATMTTIISILISLPLAILTARYKFPGQNIFNALLLVPLILPPFVGAIGLQNLLGRSGAINTFLINIGFLDTGIDFIGRGGFWAIVFIEALHLYPIIYLNATAAIANVDSSLDEAAQSLGAPLIKRLKTILFPLIRPGLFAGSTIVFIWSFTELGTPLMFDYQIVTPVQIFSGLKEIGDSPRPYAMTAMLLIVATTIYILGRFLFGKSGHATYGKAARASYSIPLKGLPSFCATGACLTITLLAILPHLSVIATSFSVPEMWYQSILPSNWTIQNYQGALEHPMAIGSIKNSLGYASIAVLFDLVIGLVAGYLIVRTKAFGRSLIDALCMLPLAVPGLVMAFGYVAMSLKWPFGENGIIDESVASVLTADPNPAIFIIIAYAVRRLPYIVRSVVAGLEQSSGALEEAALNLGASYFRAARTIIIPLIMANLIAGGLLAFTFAMLEVSDSIILAQRESDYPITKAIYILHERLGDGPFIASAMGVWSMLLLGVTLIGASVLLGRKLGAIFRI